MTLDVLGLILVFTVHGVLFARSKSKKRLRALVFGVIILILIVPFVVLGIMIGLNGNPNWVWLAQLLIHSPVVIAACSFLPYYLSQQRHSSHHET